MDQPVIVIGAGGHARVLLDTLGLLGRDVLFATDQDTSRHGNKILQAEVRGSDERIFEHRPEDVQLVMGIGSSHLPRLREQLFMLFKEKGYRFTDVIHPGAVVSPRVTSGEGLQAMAGAVIQTGCNLGDNVLINTNASVDHDCFIEHHSHIAPGATLSGHVSIGSHTHVGAAATVIQNKSIGRFTVIGAGSVVIHDIPDNAVAMGVPAKVQA